MSITLGDIKLNARDHLGHYRGSTLDPGQLNRQINRAIEYIKRRFGLPSDEKIFSFNFNEDQIFIDLPSDFDESILVKYQDNYYNRPGYDWTFVSYPDLFRQLGNYPGFKYSFTTINGRKQLMMVGANTRRGELLFDFDAVGDWVVDDDASSLALDEFQKYTGSGSLSFDITNSTGVATLEIEDLSLDLEDLFENNGYIKFWNYMTDNNIDDVTLKLMVDDSNYYQIVEDDQDDGTAFAENEWTKIGFSLDEATKVGTPSHDDTFTKIRIEYDLGSGFTSATDFRVDQMFTTFPDPMDLVYYSSIKGTDAAGTTNKTQLTADDDKLSIGEFFEDYTDAIARRVALAIMPQLKGDPQWYGVYTQEWNEMMKTLSRTYPRKRTQVQHYQTKIRR